MKRVQKTLLLILLPILVGTVPAAAQRVLTLEECREMAVEASRDLDEARTQVEMAGYDQKIARANYFPNISATGAYLHNNRNLSLLPLNISEGLTTAGTAAQARYDASLQQIRQLLASDPQIAAQLMADPNFAGVMQLLSMADIETPLNTIGQEINDAFTIDISNIYVGAVTVVQPVFMGAQSAAGTLMLKLTGCPPSIIPETL